MFIILIFDTLSNINKRLLHAEYAISFNCHFSVVFSIITRGYHVICKMATAPKFYVFLYEGRIVT